MGAIEKDKTNEVHSAAAVQDPLVLDQAPVQDYIVLQAAAGNLRNIQLHTSMQPEYPDGKHIVLHTASSGP